MGKIIDSLIEIERMNREMKKEAEVIGKRLNWIIDKFGTMLQVAKYSDFPISVEQGYIIFFYKRYKEPFEEPFVNNGQILNLYVNDRLIITRSTDPNRTIVNGADLKGPMDTSNGTKIFHRDFKNPFQDLLLRSLTIEELDLPDDSLELLIYERLKYFRG